MRILTLTLGLLFVSLSSFATEGMFIPALLESIEDNMRAMGLEISAEDIYSVNNSSLKDAIAQFGGGCTSEIISSQGLLLTNHHCGYRQIQQHSSLENNYLKDGFWAMSMAEELTNPGLTATFIVRMDDVTAKMLQGITDDMSAQDRAAKRKENEAAIIEAMTRGTNHEAFVRPFNYGNSYFSIVTKTYKDVRLVGAPPSAIGKFGGDTDNWVWPRHTGDFSLFRIYAGPDNEPAEYSEENRPYEPVHYLPVSIDGVEEGDFTMVYGFPGRTEQYLTTDAVDYVINTANPMRIHMRETSLNIIDQAMRSSEKIQIQYAAKQSSISNAYKKWIGQNGGLIELDALGKKQRLEDSYRQLASLKGKKEYVDAIDRLKVLHGEIRDYRLARDVFIEYYFYGPEILSFANSFSDLIENYEGLEEEGELKKALEGLKSSVKSHFKDYHQPTDEAIYSALTELYFDNMPGELIPDQMRTFKEKNKNSIERMKMRTYERSIFTSEQALMKLLDSPSAKAFAKLMKDPAYQQAAAHYAGYFQKVRPQYGAKNQEIDALMKTYVAGLMELFPNKPYWADANSTLRLTYGKAEGSAPVDGMAYRFYTTANGILQKHATGNPDFEMPADLIEKLEARNYGLYAHKDGELRICFTGSNHTTGGNSGSPAINGKGQLVGLNFDRSWESTMSDILFDPGRCRNIMVDIRYVLWVIDVYAGAGHLVDEMTLVRGEEKAEMEPEMEMEPTPDTQ
ncbi:MAG: S46 family peptidase [Flavobacteriales bacterium]|nr:S46 family peptidase [Flavobacteriales bacterium]